MAKIKKARIIFNQSDEQNRRTQLQRSINTILKQLKLSGEVDTLELSTKIAKKYDLTEIQGKNLRILVLSYLLSDNILTPENIKRTIKNYTDDGNNDQVLVEVLAYINFYNNRIGDITLLNEPDWSDTWMPVALAEAYTTTKA